MPPASEIFNGERLQLAREFRGWTQKRLAKETVTSDTLISLYEGGKRRDPAPDLLDALASVLGFEPAFFYGPLEDPFREDQCNFRHRRTTPERLKTRVRAQATLLGMVIQRMRQYLKFPPLNLPRIPASSVEDAEDAAERARQFWRLGLDAPILQITRVMERAGVIVVQHMADSAKIDAFSRNGSTAVVFLNTAVASTSRWNFDIAHECGHLVLHDGIPTGDEQTEREADRFASAFLMPRKAFAREFQTKPFSWSHVFDLKRRWRTSAAAIVRRAYDLGLIGAVRYRQAFQYISLKRWKAIGEPMEPDFQEPELLAMALTAINSHAVDVTLDRLCAELHFAPETFRDITGAMPAQAALKPSVIAFPGTK